MRAKLKLKCLRIVLCIVLVTILSAFPSCKKDRSGIDQPASLGISAADNSPTWSSDGKRIFFDTDRDGNWEVYAMDTDGSNQTRLTRTASGNGMPAMSPDGTKIVFQSSRDGNREIYLMNADGSNQVRLTNTPANEINPKWSPDSSKIVFDSLRDGNMEIYVMNADGSDQTRLTDNRANDRAPCWSPDGERIVFQSFRDRNPEIYLMDPDGSNQTRLTENSAGDGAPQWSPDGKKIVFVSDRDGNREIYTMNADGSNQIRVTHNPAYDGLPSWSPDGKKIAFESNRDFDYEIYVMNADGSNPVNLTKNAPIDESYGLSPVPQSELDLDEIPFKIVFESTQVTDGQKNDEICMVDANGLNLINLTQTLDVNERYPRVSPNGSRICFEAIEGEEKNKSRNVYIMNIDGTGRVKIAENAYQPCWSPDGKFVAYLPGEYPRFNPRNVANKGMEFYELETGVVTRHPNEEIQHLFCVDWSPDGNWLVAAGRGPIRAYGVDDMTENVVPAPGCTPDIGSDGKRLAWNGTDYSLHSGALDLSASPITVIDHRLKVACEREYWIYHADWSPDGKYLAFTYGFDDDDKPVSERKPWSHICVCDLETGKWTQITSNSIYNEQPDWVPVQAR